VIEGDVTFEGGVAVADGTLRLSGDNTYAGATIISAGTLLLASGTVTGNGNWTVSSGAALEVDGTLAGSGSLALDGTLSGSGLVNRTVTTGGIASMIEAGNGPGTLTVASLNATSGVSFAFELGNSSDLVQISGGFVGGGFDDSLQFQFFDSGGLQAGVAYTLLTYGSASGLDESDFLVVTNGFVVDTWNIGGNSLSVTFSAIPEPGSLALIALALGGLGMVRRRRSAP
jgi:fibronectin-binding autotransporter adhesin